MAIYEIEASSNKGNFIYMSLVLSEELDDSSFNMSIKGIKQGSSWTSPSFEWHIEENGSLKKDKADFAYVFAGSLNLAANSKAKKILSVEFPEDIEFLPIRIHGENDDWYLINVINQVQDALSLENCEFKIRGNGSVGRLTKAVFNSEKIPDERPFIYPQRPSDLMFKGKKFIDIVADNQLTGLSFDQYESV